MSEFKYVKPCCALSSRPYLLMCRNVYPKVYFWAFLLAILYPNTFIPSTEIRKKKLWIVQDYNYLFRDYLFKIWMLSAYKKLINLKMLRLWYFLKKKAETFFFERLR